MAMTVAMTCLAAAAWADEAEPVDPEAVVPQVVELVRFVATGDGPVLEGELWIPTRATAATTVPGAVICHPHPLYGGTMDNAIVIRLRDKLLDMGIATLRFNFRGIGNSEGEFGGGVAEANDALGAMALLRSRPEIQADRCGLVGYSFGASMALKAASALQQVEGAEALACGVVGFPTEIDEDGLGDFAHLAQVKCPVIFVTGTEDIYSHAGPLGQLVTDHSLAGKVVPIEGADHFFSDATWRETMAQTIAHFMARHLLGGI